MLSPTRHLLANKTPVCVRMFTPQDREMVLKAFTRLSADTRYYRFGTTQTHLFDDVLQRVLHPKKGIFETWGATAIDRPVLEALGAASFIRKSRLSKKAEISFTITDEAQNLGIATLLLARLWTRAEALKIHTFTGSILFDNYRTLEWFRHLGAKLEFQGSSYQFTLPVSESNLHASAASFHLISRLQELRRFVEPRSFLTNWRD